jgi:hypothetical protein
MTGLKTEAELRMDRIENAIMTIVENLMGAPDYVFGEPEHRLITKILAGTDGENASPKT